LYRVLAQWSGSRPFRWPDDATWDRLNGIVHGLARTTVDAALVIFEEAGVASREVLDGRSEVQLFSTARRDLAESLRYREGRREREAFEACAAWAVQASPFDLLQSLAGNGEAGLRGRAGAHAVLDG
jgi:hypothetical protein